MMIRLICVGIATFVVGALSSQQASAQYYVPNFVYQVPYQSPVVYYQAPRAVYYPRDDYYRRRVYRSYDPYYYPGGIVYNNYGRRRVVVQSTTTTPTDPRPITGHPSHYFGDPHASQTLTPALSSGAQ